MWLPHDDDVDVDWVIAAEHALEDVAVILALATLRWTHVAGAPGPDAARLRVDPRLADPDPCRPGRSGHRPARLRRLELLGVAFRGVLRRRSAVPLPAVDERGSWADLLWVTRMSSRRAVVPVEAATSSAGIRRTPIPPGPDLRANPGFVPRLLPEMLDGLDRPSRLRHRCRLDERTRVPAFRRGASGLASRDGLVARDRRIEEFRSSTSWRLTLRFAALLRAAPRSRAGSAPASLIA